MHGKGMGQIFPEKGKYPDQDRKLKKDQDRELGSAAEEDVKQSLPALPDQLHDVALLLRPESGPQICLFSLLKTHGFNSSCFNSAFCQDGCPVF